MIRTPLLAGLATLALLSAPAMAQNVHLSQTPAGLTPRVMPAPVAGLPGLGGLASTNVLNATNVGAGIGNAAKQQVTGVQSGSPAGSMVRTNVLTATNVGAGIGNTAQQQVTGLQGNGVRVGLNFSGRGPLVTTDVTAATNVGAGIGNVAGQGLLAKQR